MGQYLAENLVDLSGGALGPHGGSKFGLNPNPPMDGVRTAEGGG